MPLRLLIATRVPLFAEGLCALLQHEVDIAAERLPLNVAIADRLSATPPDIILTDRETGGALLDETKLGPSIRLIVIQETPFDPNEAGSLQRLVPRGLSGVLDRRADSHQLVRAIRSVAGGELWFDHNVMRETLCGAACRSQVHLTPRESDVLRLVCDGCSNKEIAHRLCLSEQTVKTHCNHLYKKFGVTGRLKLALCAANHAAEALHSTAINEISK